MKPRCIDCRENFNRAAAEDKLRCPPCAKLAGEPAPKWKEDLKRLKPKKQAV